MIIATLVYEKQQKLNLKSEKCILMGNLLEQKKVRVSRDVILNESTSWYIVDLTPSKPIVTDLDIDLEEED